MGERREVKKQEGARVNIRERAKRRTVGRKEPLKKPLCLFQNLNVDRRK